MAAITAEEHARRLAILVDGLAVKAPFSVMALEAGLAHATFYNWVARFHPEHIGPRRMAAEKAALRHSIVKPGLDAGKSWAAMAIEAGCDKKTLRQWAELNGYDVDAAGDGRKAVHVRVERERFTPTFTLRNCLRCGDQFKSHGPGNRMCVPCHGRAASSSPYEPDYGRAARQMPARRA